MVMKSDSGRTFIRKRVEFDIEFNDVVNLIGYQIGYYIRDSYLVREGDMPTSRKHAEQMIREALFQGGVVAADNNDNYFEEVATRVKELFPEFQ